MSNLHAQDPQSWLETIWNALHAYREDCIPEGDESYDEQWNDITTAMAWITEDLGCYTLTPDECYDHDWRDSDEDTGTDAHAIKCCKCGTLSVR